MYNFDEKIDRHNTHCSKWKIGEGALPFGIADMEFACPPQIINALHDCINNRIFGYTIVDGDDLFHAVAQFSQRQHDYLYEETNIFHSNGIVPTIGHLINLMTNKGDAVIIQPPVYGAFKPRIEVTERTLVENRLKLESNIYKMDLVDFEQKIIANNVKLFILCNPHNPVGRVYTEQELTDVVDICKKHDVLIISDEIHRDLLRLNQKHTPLEKVANDYKNSIVTCMAPSKTFNLAGAVFSFVVINNEELKNKWRSYVNDYLCIETGNINVFSRAAALCAFTECDDWLLELRQYMDENMNCVKEFMDKHFPLCKFEIPQATYLAWLDMSGYYNGTNIHDDIYDACKLEITSGEFFGADSKKFIRLNVSCPREMLKEGLERLLKLK